MSPDAIEIVINRDAIEFSAIETIFMYPTKLLAKGKNEYASFPRFDIKKGVKKNETPSETIIAIMLDTRLMLRRLFFIVYNHPYCS